MNLNQRPTNTYPVVSAISNSNCALQFGIFPNPPVGNVWPLNLHFFWWRMSMIARTLRRWPHWSRAAGGRCTTGHYTYDTREFFVVKIQTPQFDTISKWNWDRPCKKIAACKKIEAGVYTGAILARELIIIEKRLSQLGAIPKWIWHFPCQKRYLEQNEAKIHANTTIARELVVVKIKTPQFDVISKWNQDRSCKKKTTYKTKVYPAPWQCDFKMPRVCFCFRTSQTLWYRSEGVPCETTAKV